MKPAIRFREYKASDKQALIVLQNELMDHFLTKDKIGIFRREKNYGSLYMSYCLKEVKKQRGRIYVALDGDKIVGFVIGAIYKKISRVELSFYKPIKTGYIFLIYVTKAYQKHRIGGHLMDMMETYFKQQDCDIVRLDATGSHTSPYKYYRKRDYRAWAVDMIKPLKRL